MAATPAGLEAMKALAKESRGEASNAMCTFLVLNVSSLQLIPVSMIAYRSQYHSAAPAAVVYDPVDFPDSDSVDSLLHYRFWSVVRTAGI